MTTSYGPLGTAGAVCIAREQAPSTVVRLRSSERTRIDPVPVRVRAAPTNPERTRSILSVGDAPDQNLRRIDHAPDACDVHARRHVAAPEIGRASCRERV